MTRSEDLFPENFTLGYDRTHASQPARDGISAPPLAHTYLFPNSRLVAKARMTSRIAKFLALFAMSSASAASVKP